MPAPRAAPGEPLLTTLAHAGLSDVALDAAGGKGTARRLRGVHADRERRARRRLAWRRYRAPLFELLFIAVVVVAIVFVFGVSEAVELAVKVGGAAAALLVLGNASRRRS